MNRINKVTLKYVYSDVCRAYSQIKLLCEKEKQSVENVPVNLHSAENYQKLVKSSELLSQIQHDTSELLKLLKTTTL